MESVVLLVRRDVVRTLMLLDVPITLRQADPLVILHTYRTDKEKMVS